MAFKRTFYSAAFASGLTTTEKQAFVDNTFDRWVTDGIDGVIIADGGCPGCFILEGDSTAVDSEVTTLNGAQELTSQQVLHTEKSGSARGYVISHMEGDQREKS